MFPLKFTIISKEEETFLKYFYMYSKAIFRKKSPGCSTIWSMYVFSEELEHSYVRNIDEIHHPGEQKQLQWRLLRWRHDDTPDDFDEGQYNIIRLGCFYTHD